MPKKETKPSIQVIARMMRLVDALARHSAPASLKLLASETRLHPSTAHRILNVMAQDRMVERVEPGTYRLGMRLLELGTLVRSRISFRHEAWPCMQQLHQQLGESIGLAVRRDDEILYVERTASAGQMPRGAPLAGLRATLHATAAGKIFLAAETSDRCVEYATRTGLPRITDNTIVDQAKLLVEIENVRRQGYAFDGEEAEKGVSCVAAGIHNDENQVVAALSIAAPAERYNKAWAIQVKQAAERVSRTLGHQPALAASATI